MFYKSNDSPDTEMDSISHLLHDEDVQLMSATEYKELQDEFVEFTE